MKVIFLGTGEAFDENNPNNSSLVISKEVNLLLDCGFRVPYQMWKYDNDQNFLDGVYISHAHADHYFGLPALLTRMWEEKRTKPFTVICQKGFREVFENMMELGYEGSLSNFEYEIKFIETEPGQEVKFNDLNFTFAYGKHFVKDMAIKIENNGKKICYSGDTTVVKEVEELLKDSDLLIHEAYMYDEPYIYDDRFHTVIVDLIKMVEGNNIKCLALTHINRDLRQGIIDKKLSSDKVKIIIPEPFDEYEV